MKPFPWGTWGCRGPDRADREQTAPGSPQPGVPTDDLQSLYTSLDCHPTMQLSTETQKIVLFQRLCSGDLIPN